jgi:hypothetical protein
MMNYMILTMLHLLYQGVQIPLTLVCKGSHREGFMIILFGIKTFLDLSL